MVTLRSLDPEPSPAYQGFDEGLRIYDKDSKSELWAGLLYDL